MIYFPTIGFWHDRPKYQRDIIILVLNLAIAVWLVASGVADRLYDVFGTWGLLGAFLAGVGFASAFFAIPATVVIFNIAQEAPFWIVAITAAAGAMVGDWVILRVLRDGITDDFRLIVEQFTARFRIATLFKSRVFYWFSAFVAALVIASPLPDELGLAIFGMLRFDTKRFLPVSFALNFLGILIITLFAELSVKSGE